MSPSTASTEQSKQMANGISLSSGGFHHLRLSFADVILFTAFLAFFLAFFLLLCFLCCFHRCLHSFQNRLYWSSNANNNNNNNITSSGDDGNQKLEILSSLPTFEFSSPASDEKKIDCVVCLSELKEGERCRLLPRCNHGFHKECIDAWLGSSLSCPLCRAAVIAEEQR